MSWLELKIPPPLVALLLAGAMYPLGTGQPPLAAPRLALVLALAVAGVGGLFELAGGLAFRRAKTTVNPLQPARTTALVTGGVYRITRNPMYVGLALVLLAWTIALAAPLALLGPLAFVLYIGRFQIAPEERVLAARFGEEYARYRARVRRWL